MCGISAAMWDFGNDLWGFGGDVIDTTVNAAEGVFNAGSDVFGDVWDFGGDVWDFGSAAVDTAVNIVEHPIETAEGVADWVSDGTDDVGDFISDHGKEILTGAQIAIGAALTPVLGPVGAALLAAGLAAAADIADGKSAEDTLVDALAAGADKFIPGSGHAAEAIVHGLENGESIQQIAEEAGLGGLAGSGDGALGFAGTLVDDLAQGRSPEEVLRDLGMQYAHDAMGGAANPFGEAGIIVANDVIDGKSAGDIGLDLAKAYLDNAAGGEGSPTANMINTFIDGLAQGKSAGEIAADLVHEGVRTLQQIEAGAPGAIDDALGESGIYGANYAATFVDDLVQGKSPEQAAEHAFGQAAGDAFDQSGLGDAFQQAGLDPFRPYLETAAEDLANGKSFEQIGSELLGDAFRQSGLADTGGGDLSQWIDHAGINLPDLDGGNLPPWAKVIDTAVDFGADGGIHLDWIELNPQPLPPGPDDYVVDYGFAAAPSEYLEIGPRGSVIALQSALKSVALNPQPLPPGPDDYVVDYEFGICRRSERVSGDRPPRQRDCIAIRVEVRGAQSATAASGSRRLRRRLRIRRRSERVLPATALTPSTAVPARRSWHVVCGRLQLPNCVSVTDRLYVTAWHRPSRRSARIPIVRAGSRRNKRVRRSPP